MSPCGGQRRGEGSLDNDGCRHHYGVYTLTLAERSLPARPSTPVCPKHLPTPGPLHVLFTLIQHSASRCSQRSSSSPPWEAFPKLTLSNDDSPGPTNMFACLFPAKHLAQSATIACAWPVSLSHLLDSKSMRSGQGISLTPGP